MSKLQDAMLALLKSRREHFTAERLLAAARVDFPTACLATVYRNLDIFTREGKIRRVSVSGGASIYEGNTARHDHAICLHCGKVLDVSIPGLRELIASNLNGEVVSVDLTVNYLCAECADAAKPAEER